MEEVKSLVSAILELILNFRYYFLMLSFEGWGNRDRVGVRGWELEVRGWELGWRKGGVGRQL